jgi:pimeloyl-ACP methyl ester carboxylesterase
VISKAKRWLVAIFKIGSLVIIGAIIAGSVYEQLGRRRDLERLPQIGRSVDIGGRSLNIYCSGNGAPSVILESPGGGPGYVWAQIQPQIANYTNTCWYDRAGEGWSDPGPFPRTSEAIAKDLHELLQRAGLSPPYVLVGYSVGGLNVRVFNGLYPNEVAGMVLVDSAHEDEPQRAPKFMLARTAPRYLWHPLHLFFQTSARLGLLRLTHSSRPLSDTSQQTSVQIVRALRRQPKSVANDASTGIVEPESYAQAHSAGGLGDRPLVVLTAGKPLSFGDAEMARQAAAWQQVWIHEIQAKLARLSSHGRQIIVENSDHGIVEQSPEALVQAVQEILNEIRKEP